MAWLPDAQSRYLNGLEPPLLQITQQLLDWGWAHPLLWNRVGRLLDSGFVQRTCTRIVALAVAPEL
jgi:hypothetical protein